MNYSDSLNKRIDKFAELSIKKGINVQPGQTVIIYTTVDPEAVDFAHRQQLSAYKAGAAEVVLEYRDDISDRLFFENAANDVIDTAPEWIEVRDQYLINEKHASRLSTISDDPDGLNGLDANKLAAHQKAILERIKARREATMKDDISWLVNAAPSVKWAEKVFPDKKSDQAVNQLWEAILKTVRITDDNDPIAEWDQHIDILRQKAKFLNDNNFKELHYKSEKSDFTIGLAEGHIWEAAYSTDKAGNVFIPNMPTEEVFTAPDNRNLSGHVAATKPLGYQGTLINDIQIDFENGKIIKATASSGEAQLKSLIETDEGSHSLGEVSLVPHSSPISQSGILWYSTLFDENAADHLAIGAAYASNIKDGKTASLEELAAKGWNKSDVHEDFMVGSADMNVVGITQDGKEIPVMNNGEWV
jgi:aminopeptidase